MGEKSHKDFEVVFFETTGGKQPVREFIWRLTKEDKRELGADIRTVQMGFPMGLPFSKKGRYRGMGNQKYNQRWYLPGVFYSYW